MTRGTARRSGLHGYAGYGYCLSHSRWYWGVKLTVICTCGGTITGFGLANPKLYGERQAARPGHRRRHGQGPLIAYDHVSS
jgi:hypothetical protein